MSDNKKIRILDFLNNGIYPGHILFSVGYTFKEIHDKLLKMKYTDYAIGIKDRELKHKQVTGTAFSVELIEDDTGEERTLFYIVLQEFNFTDDDYCVLAHEIVHICQFYLKFINVNRNNEVESDAFYHTHLMKQCLKLLRDHVK